MATATRLSHDELYSRLLELLVSLFVADLFLAHRLCGSLGLRRPDRIRVLSTEEAHLFGLDGHKCRRVAVARLAAETFFLVSICGCCVTAVYQLFADRFKLL